MRAAAGVRPTLAADGVPHLATITRRNGRREVRVLRLQDGGWTAAVELETDVDVAHVQPVGDGFLAAAAECVRRDGGEVEPNATLHDGNGRETDRLVLGDGIEDLQASAAGDVWVAYNDTGVRGDDGARGWGRLSPSEWVEPIGVAGLVRVRPDGERTLTFSPPHDGPVIADCYALNTSDESAWVSYHPFFPIVRVDPDGEASIVIERGTPAEAFAIVDDDVITYAGYADGSYACQLVRGGERSAVRLLVDGRGPLAADHVRWAGGRGPVLHVLLDDAWCQLDLRSV